jgi:peptide deformylase
MTARPCIPWPDKRLRTAAAPVDAITDDIRAIWTDMIDTMEAMPGCRFGCKSNWHPAAFGRGRCI